MGTTTTPASSSLRDALSFDRLQVERVTLLRLLALPVFAGWIWWDASVSPSRLGSLGAVLLALLGIGLLTQADELGPLDRARRVLTAALVAFVSWNFLSLLWADFPAAAWNGSNRALVYGVAFALFFLWPWRDRELVLAVALFALVVAGSALATVARILASGDPAAFLEEGRLAFPTGYANGNAALWTLGALLTLPLAASRDLGPWVRTLALASTTLLLGLGVLTQSRGWLVGLPLALILLLLCGRNRLRLALAAGIAAISVAAVARPLDAVFERYAAGDAVGPPLERALWLLLAASAGTAAIGACWASLDRRVDLSGRAHRALTIAAAAALVLALAAGLALGVRAVGNPGAWVTDKWDEFAAGTSGETEGSRLSGSLASDRYQNWRVAVEAFEGSPVIGVGSDNYAAEYLLRRDDNRSQPIHPHSTPLRVVSQLGIVGAVLFLVLVIVALVLGIRRRATASPLVAAAAGAALSCFAFWLVAGSFDVLWEIPALAAPAFALAGLVAAPLPGDGSRAARHGRRERVATGAAVGLLALGLASLVVTWASFSFVQSGRAAGAAEPSKAYERLDLAADLNPLSALPFVYKGLIAQEAGQAAVARAAFASALEREPRNWFAALQLGLVEATEGDQEAAAAAIARAQELNPRDPLVEIAGQLVAAGGDVDPDLFNRLYLEGLNRESVDWLVERYFQVPPYTVQ